MDYVGSVVFVVEKISGFKDDQDFPAYLRISLGKVRKKSKIIKNAKNGAFNFNEIHFFRSIKFSELKNKKDKEGEPTPVETFEIELLEKVDDDDDIRNGICEIKIKDLFQEKVNFFDLPMGGKNGKYGRIKFEVVPFYTSGDMISLYKDHFENNFTKVDWGKSKEKFFFQRPVFDESSKKIFRLIGDEKFNWKVFEGLDIEPDEEKYLNLSWKLTFYYDKHKNVKGYLNDTIVWCDWGNIKTPQTLITFGTCDIDLKKVDLIIMRYKRDKYVGTHRLNGSWTRRSDFKGVWKVLHLAKRSNYLEDCADVTGFVNTKMKK